MSRIPVDAVALVPLPQSSELGAGATESTPPRLIPGEILQARVVRVLESGLFAINIRGGEVIASSTRPLSAGQVLTLQVARAHDGRPTLVQVVTTAEGQIAQAISPESLPANAAISQLSSSQNLPAATGSTPVAPRAAVAAESHASSTDSSDAFNASTSATSTRSSDNIARAVADLVRPEGFVAQFLRDRPDLAARVAHLLGLIANRPPSIGTALAQLVDDLGRAFAANTRLSTSAAAEASPRFATRLIPAELFEHPGALADFLATRLAGLVRGFEANATRQLAQASPSPSPPNSPQPGSVPASVSAVDSAVPSASVHVSQSLQVGGAGTAGRPATPTASVAREATLTGEAFDAATGGRTNQQTSTATSPADVNVSANTAPSTTTIRLAASDRALQPGVTVARESAVSAIAETVSNRPTADAKVVPETIEQDLKGQLLQLRAELNASAGETTSASASIRQAIGRADQLLEQITAQQVRNVDGHNQYFYVELPVDPRSGVSEARLQVFYRQTARDHRSSELDPFTVALFLNLASLGDVLAVVTGIGPAVSVAFTVEHSAIESLLAAHAEELRSALVSAGHSAATVTVRRLYPSDREVAFTDSLWDLFLNVEPRPGEPGGRLDAKV
jgi:hypothetical protein